MTNSVNFQSYITDYLTFRKSSLKPSTYANYDDMARVHLIPAFGALELTSITKRTVETWLQQANEEKRCGARRLNSILVLLKQVLADAQQNRLIPDNPCGHIKKLNCEPLAEKTFSREEISDVIAQLDPRFVPFFTAFACTGARPNELLALRWDAIDFEKNEMHIRLGRVRVRSQHIESKELKTKSSTRVVPLPEALKIVLKSVERKSDYVFCTSDGAPLSERSVQRAWDRACGKANVPHRRMYLLRHSLGTWLVSLSVPLNEVAAQFGHASIGTTIKVYVKPVHEAQSEQILRSALAKAV